MAKEEKKGTTIATPINILWENILMIPIFGAIDSKQAQEIMENILTRISDSGSKVIILDILGVATVDTAVANYILKITRATGLMGCRCIVSGISPAIAQTLVNLGVGLEGVATTASLRDALETAFDTIGLEVRKIKKVP
ncbi:MAG: STAS domain-containing protein [Deltaproteobacteria bacterium]|nr:STAS domain-containing protein [Deltaproteobacteria bacterium]